MKLTIEEIASLLPSLKTSTQIRRGGVISRLLTDSRSLEKEWATEYLFFAIPTSENDGHNYIGRLYENGVRNFIVNYIPDIIANKEDVNLLVVPDTVAALQRIGRRHGFEGNLLAITGSQGKTTLKELIYQLMEPLTGVTRSPRSFNSQIGVPLSMWEMDRDARIGIIEAGVSQTGEMQRLSECIRPDAVIITNIGQEHDEGFADLKEKAAEKAILASHPETKVVIYNADNRLIDEAIESEVKSANTLTWSLEGNERADIIASLVESNGNLAIRYRMGRINEDNPITGEIKIPERAPEVVENIMNALTFMLYSGIDSETIAERFSNLNLTGTRLNVSEGVNGCSIILDSYPSDFTSLRPALDFLRRRKTGTQTTTLIISDIQHESADEERMYTEVANLVRSAGIDRLIGVGRNLTGHRNLFGSGSLFFETTDDLLESLSPSDFTNEAILLKGSPEFRFSEIADMLETRRHETVLEVNLDSIVANYKYFKSHLPKETGIVCMVKASGYGAGSYEIAKTLQDCGAAYLAVAVLDEGIELRRQGITMPIMVMNPKVVNYKSMFANRLEPEIYSFEMLEDVIREAAKNDIDRYPIHIKLDTGMHRMGFIKEELPELMEILNKTSHVRVKSVFSHLATADCPDMNDYTDLQLQRFREYTEYMLSRTQTPFQRHILNSAGILRYGKTDHYDMARLGIGLYGANTLPSDMEKPLAVVSTLRTVIIAIREWGAEETIGYGRRGKLTRKSRIATIPIGYADGMNRHFGRGNVSVLVNGKEAPTVGNICMDACMIDVTDIDCKIGDSVEIFGENAPLQRLADALDTIPYEILTSVSPRVKRIYYRE